MRDRSDIEGSGDRLGAKLTSGHVVDGLEALADSEDEAADRGTSTLHSEAEEDSGENGRLESDHDNDDGECDG